MKTTKQYKKYIPQLISDELDLIEHPRKDNLYIILHLINHKHSWFKTKLQREYSFAEISSKLFGDYLNKNEVKSDIDFLVTSGFIDRNDSYDVNTGRCKGYRIAQQYVSNNKTVTITNKNINKKIEIQNQRLIDNKDKELKEQRKDYIKNFRIKQKEALAYLDMVVRLEIKSLCDKIHFRISNQDLDDLLACEGNYKTIKKMIVSTAGGTEFYNIMHKFCIYTAQIYKINDGYLYFKRNNTNGRLDTNLTSLPSFLRPFIECDENLYSIDLKNSQPFFLYSAIKDEPTVDETEKENYKNLVVSGDTGVGLGLYEFLEVEYEKEFKQVTTRKKMKEMLFKIFYSRKSSYAGYKTFFKKHFPTINDFINEQKKVHHKDFSVMLQKIESDVVIKTIMPRLLEKGIKPYTIHDSFICKESEYNTVVDTIVEVTKELFGFTPNLHIDCLTIIDIDEPQTPIIDDEIEFDYSEEHELSEPVIVMEFGKTDSIAIMNKLKTA